MTVKKLNKTKKKKREKKNIPKIIRFACIWAFDVTTYTPLNAHANVGFWI